jgi:hypothetical protein
VAEPHAYLSSSPPGHAPRHRVQAGCQTYSMNRGKAWRAWRAIRTIRSRGALLATAAIAIVVAGFGALYLVRRSQQPALSLGFTSSEVTALGSPSARSIPAESGPYPGLTGQVTVVCPGKTLTTEGGPDILARNDCTPSFTAQDARAYLAHSTGLGKIEAKGRLVATRVIFLTIRDLDRLTNDPEWEANSPPNLLICHVGLSGTFSVSAPSVIGGA